VTAIANFIGPFLFGVAVANTIGNDVVDSNSINLVVILAALCSAILWDLLTWYLGFPSSSSHALVGGIVGATVMGAGWQAIKWDGLTRVLIALFASPINWVIFMCATMIAAGTALGGWRLIRTLGAKMFRIRPVDGFTSQLSSTFVILGASLLGGPVSSTQVISSSIMGVGAAGRVNKVRWGVARDLAVAWLLTIPISALVAAVIYWSLSLFFN
jgi:phosphate/sulfate permease